MITIRMTGTADDLTETDEQPIEPLALLRQKCSLQDTIRLFGAFTPYETQKIHETVHMRIHGGDFRPKGVFQDDFRGLRAHPFERSEFSKRRRDFSPVAFEEFTAYVPNRSGLFAPESDRIDRLRDPLFREPEHRLRSIGQGEESLARFQGRFVTGLKTQ